MKKVDIGFRFRPEVVERLGSLAQERSHSEGRKVTRTQVLEDLVMGSYQPAPSEHLIDEVLLPDAREDGPLGYLRPPDSAAKPRPPMVGKVDREKVLAAQKRLLKPRGKR